MGYIVALLGSVGLLFLALRRSGATVQTSAPSGPAVLKPPASQGEPAYYPRNTPAMWTPADINRLIVEISREESYGRPELARAIVSVESGFNIMAINPNDSPPSIGLMGLKVPTARAYVAWVERAEDLFDPFTNIRAGVRFLKDLEIKWLKLYGLEGVIQMYNLGETRFRKNERAPVYLAKVQQRLAAQS